MADATIIHVIDQSAPTDSAGTWTGGAQIDDTWFEAGKTYLIESIVKLVNSGSAVGGEARLVYGGTPTAFADAETSHELTGGATNQHTEVGYLYEYTQPGTAELVKNQIRSESASGTTVSYHNELLAIKLSDDYTSGTHYHSDEETGDYATTSSKANQAAVTFTPNGTDVWWIKANAIFKIASASANHLLDLNDSVAGVLMDYDAEGEDTSLDKRSINLSWAGVPTAVSHTFAIRASHESTSFTVYRTFITALNLTQMFADVAYAYTSGAVTPGVTPTWTQTQALSIAPTATGQFVVYGQTVIDWNDTANRVESRLQINPAGGGMATYPTAPNLNFPRANAWDNTDWTIETSIMKLQLDAGAARDIELEAMHTATPATSSDVRQRVLVAFSVAKPYFPPNPAYPARPRINTLIRM